ncbi:MAG TPA: DUF3137 domain-containing protein [Symbiobacteriaceae bacterium]|nr:DUF3137 domain-containing protein [Symbiobacteriaceae bacterium]
MTSAERFAEFYRTELLPYLQQLEEQRKQIAAKVIRLGVVTGAIILAVGAAVLLLHLTPFIAIGTLFGGAVLFMFLFASMTKGYVAAFKDSIIGRIVKFVDQGLSYHKDACIPEMVYLSSQIFQHHPDRYRGEDMVRGMVGKTAIQFSEIHSEYKTETTDKDGKRKTEWHTIFKGIFFVADFNKHFEGVTVVLPDVAQRLLGRFGQTLQSWNMTRTGELVRLEDVAFEERFVVYSTDQIEARYLLSPGLMARIVDFCVKTGQQVYLSFVGSHIFVAIPHSKDMFEPKLFSPIVSEELARDYLQDLLLAVGIVEELDLNTRIWTKQ